jgi:hypothetical protein
MFGWYMLLLVLVVVFFRKEITLLLLKAIRYSTNTNTTHTRNQKGSSSLLTKAPTTPYYKTQISTMSER